MDIESIVSSQEVELAEDAFIILGTFDFFTKMADRLTFDLISRFETIPVSERATEMDRISAIRTTLLGLAEESRLLAKKAEDSGNKENDNEIRIHS